MPTYNSQTGHHDLPVDTELPARLALLEELGLNDRRPMAEMDALADRFAIATSDLKGGQVFTGIINIITHDQFFAGLSTPRAAGGHSTGEASAAHTERTMSRSEGWCVYTLDRRLAFTLDDVRDWPRSVGNGAMHKLGVKTYLGAPMIHPSTGISLGTACVIGRQVTKWDTKAVDLSKLIAAEAVGQLMSLSARRALI
ncbi:GAF domain-containing protein [Streptomyces sp. NPDC059037]|uniref:GAF domain-containing protein n=1 Tax=Streptomyces sp. NPDC059037 TaxID=3346710 RepID=UPI0036812689